MTDAKLTHEILRESPRIIVLAISGEANSDNGPRIEAYVDQLLQSENPRHLLLDLSGLTFAASALFSSLLFWRETLTNQGGLLVLYGLRPEIASTLRLAALDRILKISPDQKTALSLLPG